MLNKLATAMFGSRNERLIKQLSKKVEKINALEKSMEALDDKALAAKTREFRERISKGASLEELLIEAFAVVREAGKRTLGMRIYDVQLIGGMVLHEGKIAEMRTGEGKTLVATLAVYLNALDWKGVHVVTVNDYLAMRDAHDLAPLYNFLGLSVGVIVSGMPAPEKQKAYRADITYGTNNEFGFDYLRTNMAIEPEERLQRQLNFAIVDEVDSILIDEARTPLIISGQADDNTELYYRLNELVPQLVKQEEKDGEGDFSVDEKTKQVSLTETGHDKVEKLLIDSGIITAGEGIYSAKNIGVFHHLTACLRAHYLFHKDVDYIVKDYEVVIVDEFTGRTMEGRRWSDGLHQAIEIKEGVPVKQESQTLASITYQNFFRLYGKLAGMTGTADTEAFEFQEIYGLETVVIPTNKPVARIDHTDRIYLNQDGKYQAIIAEIKECQAKGQPVLVGTASIESSETISKLLKQAEIKHEVLNAKQHQREAEIIANAGRPGTVTIATNMAGRGTDIVLGGNLKAELAALGEKADDIQKSAVTAQWQERHDAVIRAGGLHVIGAERHESRRIDNQLRGRSGRQGDPGSSRFYVALDDNLVRIFAGDKMAAMMSKLGMSSNEAIESKMVSRQIEGAQRKVEAHNFDARKHLLEYDDVANEQRKVIYRQRTEIMDAAEINAMIAEMRGEVVYRMTDKFCPEAEVRQAWDIAGLEKALETNFLIKLDIKDVLEKNPEYTTQQLADEITNALIAYDNFKRKTYGKEPMDWAEKFISLQVIDEQWKNHLATMDMLRQSIWLRSRAQKDPKREYQRESFELFSELLKSMQNQIIANLVRIAFEMPEGQGENPDGSNPEGISIDEAIHNNGEARAADENDSQKSEDEAEQKPMRENPAFANVARNDPCPCGSGQKFKDCHGKI